ncbi:uncharacterized protein LOC127848680 isoform X6 [Dreissena polymorpha]|uniref:uncharacterized protein LOC127848680 isoform X6 n=1 Tax=Dreissena polymorpha TaxID=45954 RepID=UPI0022644275|nr:uncharacterized protein LOC127848680 isoform X6 [Dreissena polymorpha]
MYSLSVSYKNHCLTCAGILKFSFFTWCKLWYLKMEGPIIRPNNIVFNNSGFGDSNKTGMYKKKSDSPTEDQQPKPAKSPSKRPEVWASPPKPQGSPVWGQVLPALQGSSPETPTVGNSSPVGKMGAAMLETPLSWKKRESPADSGIEMTPISMSPLKVNPKIRTMYNNSRREADETTEFSINPDPVPYQPSNFMSSTTMKKVPVARRHFDSFGTFDFLKEIPKRGVMLHTDRYQLDFSKAFDGMSQRERLQAELEYMERLRGIKRRREVLPHRAQLDLLMGGKKMEFAERFEIQREIQKLKSLILPQHAKDLFHGRGFTLPENHNSVKPRKFLPADVDYDDYELSSAFSPDKYSFNPETGRVHPKQRQYPLEQGGALPKINNKGYLLGSGGPIILSKERRTVESIKARLRIPTSSSQQAYMTRSRTNVTSGQVKPAAGIAGRSVTAGHVKKEVTRPEVEDLEKPRDEEARSEPSQSSRPAATPNPLKGVELHKAMSEDEQQKLKQTFNKLDTDKDGHIMFSQLQTQLPKQFNQHQEKYIKQVYDITSSNTFFGVDEFMTMSYLTNVVTALRGEPQEAYTKLNFHHLNDVILNYVELFQSVDRSHRGKISLSSLQELLNAALHRDFKSEPHNWLKVVDSLELTEPGLISKIEFLAYIPYFELSRRRKSSS